MHFLGRVSGLRPLIVLSILATLTILDCNMLRILVFCNWEMERNFKLKNMLSCVLKFNNIMVT